jgi:hypothetical protein
MANIELVEVKNAHHANILYQETLLLTEIKKSYEYINRCMRPKVRERVKMAMTNYKPEKTMHLNI